MLKAAVFASGSGSNFAQIVKASKDKTIDIEVTLLICNNENAYVLERAKQANIEVFMIDYKNNTIDEVESILIKKLNEYNIDLILLAGFLRLLSGKFVKDYKNKIINIHPSLLPKYKGLNAIENALEMNENEIGVTVHYVNEFLDDGQIILQNKVDITGLERERVFEKVHELEHDIYKGNKKSIGG